MPAPADDSSDGDPPSDDDTDDEAAPAPAKPVTTKKDADPPPEDELPPASPEVMPAKQAAPEVSKDDAPVAPPAQEVAASEAPKESPHAEAEPKADAVPPPSEEVVAAAAPAPSAESATEGPGAPPSAEPPEPPAPPPAPPDALTQYRQAKAALNEPAPPPSEEMSTPPPSVSVPPAALPTAEVTAAVASVFTAAFTSQQHDLTAALSAALPGALAAALADQSALLSQQAEQLTQQTATLTALHALAQQQGDALRSLGEKVAALESGQSRMAETQALSATQLAREVVAALSAAPPAPPPSQPSTALFERPPSKAVTPRPAEAPASAEPEPTATADAGGYVDADGDGVPDLSPALMLMVDADGDGVSDGLHADKLGLFLPQVGLRNERPFYANDAHDAFVLWWSGGKWWLGKRDQLGHNKGWLKVSASGDVPPESGWLVYEKANKAWAPMVGMVAVLAQRIALSGQVPAGADRADETIGTYARRADAHASRPMYVREGGGGQAGHVLWYHTASAHWYLGLRGDVGSDKGWLRLPMADDGGGALGQGGGGPAGVAGCWQVRGADGAWVDAPGLACGVCEKPAH